jgi:hypothetical protein
MTGRSRARSAQHADALDALLRRLDDAADEALLRDALAHAHYRPVARAAELAAEGLHYSLEPALMDAFRRLE